MDYFFDENINIDDKVFALHPDESKHITQVLRKKEGDVIYILNGKGMLFKTLIEFCNTKKVQVSIQERIVKALKEEEKIHFGVGILKTRERIELMIEKCVEGGATKISLINTKNSERNNVNLERLQKVAISALKQSGNLFLPEIRFINSLEKFLHLIVEHQKFIALGISNVEKQHLLKEYKFGSSSLVLIGPEGDFSPEEIATALKTGFKEVSLGYHRLRAETAVISALFMIKGKMDAKL